MVFNIIGVFIIFLGAWGLYFVKKHEKDMPFALFGYTKENCSITNKAKFNAIMVMQGRVIAIYIILVGAWTLITGSPITFYLLAVMPLFNVLFTKVGLIYVKINK